MSGGSETCRAWASVRWRSAGDGGPLTRLPRLRGREVIRKLQRVGFGVIRIRGSHHFLRHPDGRCTVVPVHAGEQIGPGLLRAILRDCELTAAQLDEI
ncbi:MAG: type II toxin-antitoxin system HicA family toxin [Planctomycetota bacterium]